MKLSAFNVDFSSLSPDPLGLKRPAQASVKDSYPLKKWLFYRNYLGIGEHFFNIWHLRPI